MTHRPLRSYDVRERNEKLVLSLIHGTNGISQSEVAGTTGLKPPTVFRIFSQLQRDGVIRECSPARPAAGGKGRRPAFYCVVPESLYIIGIDFWSGSAAVVVSDFAGEAVYSEVIETPRDIAAEAVMGEITALVRRAVAASGLTAEKVLGIGVGAPGIVDIGTGTIVRYPRIPGFDGYGVAERIEEEFGWPVHVHNNTAVLALGEYRYGCAAGHQSVMTFLIRSGVGGAFLQDGRVLTNRGRTVLEVGHMVLDPDGEGASGLGGSLEDYLSEGAVEAAVRHCGFASLSAFGEALVERGVSVSDACAELRGAASRFAQAVHSLSNLFNPESYLIVSRHRWLSEFLAAALDEYLDSDAPGLSEGAAAVLPQTYDPRRACHGATDLVLDRFFARDHNFFQ
ncbi:MAG: ROK family transcriptional regulator [Spirochaetaceae bacterium]